eukprot:m.921101 g.921101  ORF g.921101 m.921101 type:complete len:70 (-) comp23756_c0_seq4:107-316(-)
MVASRALVNKSVLKLRKKSTSKQEHDRHGEQMLTSFEGGRRETDVLVTDNGIYNKNCRLPSAFTWFGCV